MNPNGINIMVDEMGGCRQRLQSVGIGYVKCISSLSVIFFLLRSLQFRSRMLSGEWSHLEVKAFGWRAGVG